MASTLKLEIVTPDAIVYSEDVDMVTLPAVEGQIGVLPHHIPLLTQVVPGEIIVRKDGRDSFLAVGEGLVQITGDQRGHRHGHGRARRQASTKPRRRKHVSAPQPACATRFPTRRSRRSTRRSPASLAQLQVKRRRAT